MPILLVGIFDAERMLNEVIDEGSQDPRAFYFRGFAKKKLGRTEDAKDDFRHGAELEAAVAIESTTSVPRSNAFKAFSVCNWNKFATKPS